MFQLIHYLFTYQFLVCGIVAIIIAFYMLFKIPKSWASLSFMFFAVDVSLWEFFVFLQRTAATLESTAYFFKIVGIFFPLLIPLYLLAILNIRKERKINILSLIPGVIYVYLQSQLRLEFIPTDFGWTFATKGEMLYPSLIGLILLGYVIFTIALLCSLVKNSPTVTAKRKFKILLWSFILFQAVGVIVSNIIMAFFPHYPPIGGFGYLIAFVFIAYSMLIKEEQLEKTPVRDIFPEIFVSFLREFYNRLPSDELGQKAFRFMDFLKESGLDEHVFFVEGKIDLKTEEPQPPQILIIQKTLSYMEKRDVGYEISDHFLRVLNVAYPLIESDIVRLMKSNEDYLKKSDLIYGLADGEFISLLSEDKSLEKEDDASACLRIYKRSLLPVMRKISRSQNIDFQRELSESPLMAALEVNDYGEISIDNIRKQIMSLPKEQRLNKAIETLNPPVCWVYERLTAVPGKVADDSLNKLKLVLKLNEEKAVKLGVVSSLFSCLTKSIPQTKIQHLYLAEGFSLNQLNVFSEHFKLAHENLEGKNMLFEFKPLERAEGLVEDFMVEALANGEKCLVFTQKGSAIYAAASTLDGASIFCLSPTVSNVVSQSKKETSLPLYDTTQLLNTLNTSMQNARRTCVVLDNVSDLIMSLGVDKTYKALRHITEIVSSNRATALILLNSEAHESTVKGAFEGMFSTIMIMDQNKAELIKCTR